MRYAWILKKGAAAFDKIQAALLPALHKKLRAACSGSLIWRIFQLVSVQSAVGLQASAIRTARLSSGGGDILLDYLGHPSVETLAASFRKHGSASM